MLNVEYLPVMLAGQRWGNIVPQSIASKSQVSPCSRPHTLAKLDERTREARLVREVRAELVSHVGGIPTAPQSAMIEQAVQLRLRLACMDRKFAEGGTQTDHDSRTYLAWNNSLVRLMRQLGPAAKAKVPTLADYLHNKAATA
jgi:hypothetical protein